MNNVQMTPEERILFKQLKDNANYRAKNISFSYLSLDAAVTNSDIKIPVLADDFDNSNTAKNVTERRLQRNHVFVGTRLAMYIKKVVSGAHAQAQLFTYPNRAIFANNSTTFLNADLFGLYSGYLSMSQDGKAYEPGIEALRFLHAPETAQNGEATLNDAATPITTTLQTRFDPFQAAYSEIALASYVTLNGISDHDVVLKVPGASGLKMAHTASNTVNYVNLRVRGFLIENVNSVKGS